MGARHRTKSNQIWTIQIRRQHWEQDTERRAIKYGQSRNVDNIVSKTQNEEQSSILLFVLCLAPNVVYVSGLSIFDCSSFCVLLPLQSTSLDCPYLIALRFTSCSQCCLRLWIVHTWLLFVLCLASNVVYFSGLSILDFSSFCVLLPMLSTSLHCPYLIALRSVSCF
jgi:hypothetical protein